MKLLIVDDLTSVVNGLIQGIHWNELGIEKVCAAYNAYEAKQILLTESIDLLLCDIEMPSESGIDLLKWIRENKMDVICIFLTSHAQFDYAKEAITLGGFDYLLQPAPYEEIENAIYRAIDFINKKRGLEQKSAFGDMFIKQNEMIREKIFTDIMKGRMTEDNYKTMRKAVNLPDWNIRCDLILVQIIHMSMDISSFGEELLRFVLKNITSELFAPNDQDVIIIEQDKMIYNIIIFGTKEYSMDYIDVLHKIEILKLQLELYLKGSIACFLGEGVELKSLKEQNQKLILLKDKNLAMKNIIFQLEEVGNQKKADLSLYDIPQYDRWLKYIKQNLCQSVRNEMYEYLTDLSEHNGITQETLMLFSNESYSDDVCYR